MTSTSYRECCLNRVFRLPLPCDEVGFRSSTSASRSSASLNLGIAIGFVLPPILVVNSDDLNVIGNDLQWMFNYVAGLTTVLFLLIVLFGSERLTAWAGKAYFHNNCTMSHVDNCNGKDACTKDRVMATPCAICLKISKACCMEKGLD
uniref:Uncharacterized protein n=1 Tax=Glossina pallidipes TaxID=7398 RepID=A0A1A9Z527_GLOPL